MSNPETISLLQKIYNLPIYRKTGLIPWFSLGALALIVGAGGFILHKNVQNRWLHEAKLELEIVENLLAEKKPSEIEEILTAFSTNNRYSAIFLKQDGGELIPLSLDNNASEKLLIDTSTIEKAWQSPTTINEISNLQGEKYALAAKKITNPDGSDLGVLAYGQALSSANSTIRSSLLTQVVLATIVLIFMVALTKILGKAVAEPIQQLQQIAQDFAEGNNQIRAEVKTTDEVGLLASTFNFLADSIVTKEEQLKAEAKRSSFLKEVAINIGRASELTEILQTVVDNSRIALNADRVVYYAFDHNYKGAIIAESVGEGFPVTLGAEINDSCFGEEYAEQYQQGKVKAISNIYEAGLDDCYLKMLESFAITANVIVPAIVGEKLVGLLIAHQCDEPRNWTKNEIELLLQISGQLGTALEKIELLEQQKTIEQQERQARENLQRRALELLMEVDPVSRGDLTVRVKVQEDEIGTIADSYNSTIESLRKLVGQVQTAASLVSTTTSDKEVSIQQLSSNASEQTQEISIALARIQGIAESIAAVANNAEAAEAAVRQAAETVKAGDDAMNRTVEGFQGIRTTVAETAKKVKRLGESSQKISKVVNVISNFADQTNLLALNASIEAAHAGEEGRGFAVVADEVRSLARQSAEATAEIEALVAEIQAETNEVVAAMESGTEQVVAGTKLVDETRYSLIQIADASSQIDRLVNEIAQAAMEQSQDSKVVSQTMVQIAAISDKTATEASDVSNSFKDLLTVAQQLQESVAKFKVN